MKVLNVENLVKSYGDKILFDNISFAITETDKIGLIGINGTGKSTLLKAIAGIESTDAGFITHPNDYNIEYVPQEPSFNTELTVIEEVFSGDSPLMKLFRSYELILNDLQNDQTNDIKQNRLFAIQQEMDALNAWETNSQAKIVLNRLGIDDYYAMIKNLSGGQKKRVALAKALIQPADLLILDEPTNHIDNEAVVWLEEYLLNYHGAVLLVTHDRYFLNRVTNKIIELDKGNLYKYEGNFEIYLEKRLEREQADAQAEDKRQNILRRELAWLRRGAKARSTKQKARIERINDLTEQKYEKSNTSIDIAINSSRLGKKVIELHSLSKSFNDTTLFSDFSLLIGPKERIGIIGANGSGKSTLLNVLTGSTKPDSGVVELGQTVRIGYYKQENIDINDNFRVIDYIKEDSQQITTNDGKILSASQMLERFLFTNEMQWTYISKLSGGEKRRLYLLKILLNAPNVLILDEPTNDLDIQTLGILEEYLEDFGGVVIAVSHDRYFLDKIADKLLIFEAGYITSYYGSYSDYLLEKSASREKTSKLNTNNRNKTVENMTNNADSPKKKLSFKEQKEWDEIEIVIAQLETQLAELHLKISQETSDFTKVENLYLKERELSLQLEKMVERWAELSELIEEIERNKDK